MSAGSFAGEARGYDMSMTCLGKAFQVGYLLHEHEPHISSATVAVQEELRCLAIPLQEVGGFIVRGPLTNVGWGGEWWGFAACVLKRA